MKFKLLTTLLLCTTYISVCQNIDIRYNQLGYTSDRTKIISLTSTNNFSPLAYTVVDENNNQILSGMSETVSYWTDSREYVSKVDVSQISTMGNYKLRLGGDEINFDVSTDVYESISNATLKYYYYNRASIEISSTYGGVFARDLGHPDNNVRVHSSAASNSRPTNTIISSPKGWYDAGDYNKYIVNSGISTYTLLAAFEHYKSYYENKSLNIPETGGILPDVLDEIKWNLDWMLTMQEPADGGVYHKLTGLNFSGRIVPSNYNMQRYVVGKSTSAALNFAAVMAVASRVFSAYSSELPGYSATLLSAAEAAYEWAENNPREFFRNPSGVSTGEYGDGNVADEFQWAAVELFITTRNSAYGANINVSSIGAGVPNWQYTHPLSLISMLYHNTVFSSNDINTAKNSFLGTANALRDQVENAVMNIAMGSFNSDYVWGSNGVAANQIVLLIRAYEFTNDDSYLNAAYVAMDYILGRNGTGYSYVTGYGTVSTVNPHHRISDADGIVAPVPGMLSGGPNPGREDNCPNYINTSKAGSYVDDWCSYASNEVTINWNAPLAYAVNALNFYAASAILSTNYFDSSSSKVLTLSPNPTQGQLSINTKVSINSIVIYDSLGKIVLTATASKALNLSNIKNGMYFVKVTTMDNKIFMKSIVKE